MVYIRFYDTRVLLLYGETICVWGCCGCTRCVGSLLDPPWVLMGESCMWCPFMEKCGRCDILNCLFYSVINHICIDTWNRTLSHLDVNIRQIQPCPKLKSIGQRSRLRPIPLVSFAAFSNVTCSMPIRKVKLEWRYVASHPAFYLA